MIFVDTEKLLPAKNNAYKALFQSLLTRFKEKGMFTQDTEYFLVFNKADLVKEKNNKAAEGIIDDVELKRKRDEVTNLWEQRKRSILNIISPLITVPSNNIYEICSKGIEYESEDTKLIELFNRLITEKTPASLSPEYNWIQKLVKKK